MFSYGLQDILPIKWIITAEVRKRKKGPLCVVYLILSHRKVVVNQFIKMSCTGQKCLVPQFNVLSSVETSCVIAFPGQVCFVTVPSIYFD